MEKRKLKRSDIIAFTREIMLEYIKPAKESDVDTSELKKGISVEMEHTKDPNKAKTIALQHLAEDPKYYTKLSKVGLEENESPSKTIVYSNFQGSDISDNLKGEEKTLKVSDCIGNEPGKDFNYFNTEKKSDIDKMIKSAKENGIESFPPIVALKHPLLPGKYSVLDGNHRLGAFKIGNLPNIKAIVLNDIDVELATPDTEWEEGIVPDTISLKDAKSRGINLQDYFSTQELEIPKNNFLTEKQKQKLRTYLLSKHKSD